MSTPSNFWAISSHKKNSIPLYLIHFLTLAGIAVAVMLTNHFYEIRNGTGNFRSFCNVSETMNCDLIVASPQSEFFLGLPLSSFAAGLFLAFFLLSLIAHNAFWRREVLRVLLLVSGLSTLMSFFYFLVMTFQLKTYCLLCLTIDAISLATFLLVLSFKPEGFSTHKLDLPKWRVFGAVIAGSLFASVLGLKSLDVANLRDSEVTEVADSILNTPPVSVQTGDHLPSIGPKNAPITIVEFSDFQCPYCRMGALSLNSTMNRYPGKIRVIFRNFPLDQACNSEVHMTAHQTACEAARIAVCSNQQGQFEPTYENLFQKQSLLKSGHVADLVQSPHLDEAQLKACMTAPETATRISEDVQEAKSLGIKSTPTFFVNGHKVEGASASPVWNKVVEKLLRNHE